MAQRKRRGFSLIELLIVTFILAVGLTSVSVLFSVGIVSGKKAQRITTATNAARRELERLRSGGYASCRIDETIFPATKGYTINVQNADDTGEVQFTMPETPDLPMGSTGTITIAFYESPTGVYPNLKDVTVAVTWPSGGNRQPGRLSIHTLIANHP